MSALTDDETEGFNTLGGLLARLSQNWEPALMRGYLDEKPVAVVVAVDRSEEKGPVNVQPVAIMLNPDLLSRLEPPEQEDS